MLEEQIQNDEKVMHRINFGWPWESNTQPVRKDLDTDSLWPRISIVTPSYNQGKFIEETIRSVLLQNYPNLEYIILDGGSTDETVDIIKKYSDHLTYWYSGPDHGQCDAINNGFKRSTGEILAWLNSDDLYCPGTLRRIAQLFTNQPKTMVVSGACLMVDQDRNVIGQKAPSYLESAYLLKGGSVPGQPALFFRREVLDKVGFLNEKLHYVLDWEYWIRIGVQFPASTIQILHEPLAEARIWEQAKTSIGGCKAVEERLLVLDNLYKDHKLPQSLDKLRSTAYSSVYWRRALYHCKQAQPKSAINSFLYAAWLNPNPITNWRRVRQLVTEIAAIQ